MYIKEIVLDGFKSYAQRTTVGPFDGQFNAITGLNGSGKSNILDSICFVMGISNLSKVRATNLNDLVYKNGQAGVTKATVSLVFDNSNKSQSPIGYQNESEIVVTRQVVVNGKNKYTINGLNATNQKVADLFQSVQLNVNTPHFLIMQGRVTKVLNMKPPEILAMIEEAAGTRMYEDKREAARKIIEKKEEKMKQIQAVLREEVLPKLTKLKDERSAYIDFQNLSRKVEQLTKVDVAYQYHNAKQKMDSTVAEHNKKQSEINAMHEENDSIKSDIVALGEETRRLEEQQLSESNSVLKELETDCSEKRSVEIKAQSNMDNSLKKLKDLQEKLSVLEKTVKAENKNLENFASQHERLSAEYDKLCESKAAAEKAVEDASKMIQDVNSGKYSSECGQAASLTSQVNAAKAEKSNAEFQCEDLSKKLTQNGKSLSAKEKELQNTRRSSGQDEQRISQLQKEISQLKSKMDKMGYDKERENTLRESNHKNTRKLNDLRSKVEHIRGMSSRLEFKYTKPSPDFDDSRVIGVVAKLVDVKDPKHHVALEVAGGGKLFNVVVDTAQTAKLLLERGRLPERVTFIPLDKVQPGAQIQDDKVRRAKQIVGKENVDSAVKLVSYDQRLTNAMKFVFGGSLICADPKNAKNVCYDNQVRSRTITLDGDDYNPGGILSGGSRPNKQPVLEIASKLREVEAESLHLEKTVNAEIEELRAISATAQEFDILNQAFEAKSLELKTLQVRTQSSSTGMLRQEVESLRAEKESLTQNLQENKQTLKSATAKLAELEAKMKDEAGLKDREVKKANAALKAAQQSEQKALAAFGKCQADLDSLKRSKEVSEEEIQSSMEEIQVKTAEIEAAKRSYEHDKANFEGASAESTEAKAKFEEKKNEIKKTNKLVDQKKEEMKEKTEKTMANKLAIKELQYSLENIEKAGKDAKRKVEHLTHKYDWIEREKQFFGVPNNAYDFNQHDMATLPSKLAKLQKEKDALSRRVNMRAMNMLDEAEKRFDDLSKKQKTVENDRKTLEKTMAELDKKKREALIKAVRRVNEDFGKMFNTLLDYAFAELRAPAGQTELEGLEIRCKFGTVWKESLSELSGGQRSLVALSLILAMLKFHPAPLYILDEVDAALDASHTQNIGRLIATRFQNSQFIVVSLKDGLFNNANVLFKTQFADGISSVSRQAKRS